ncbi:MAG TPA: DUF2917 domain-containing protein [Casimicrobiaceae bacterium]|nr:DUF2917 domain-containing protein [Casimicrobiaceae bacterium]
MPFDPSTPQRSRRVHLPRRESLILNNAEGTTITVDAGCLWVTMERDPRDIVLLPGMRFEIDRTGHTVIAAEEDSRFRLLSEVTPASRAVAWLARRAARLSARWTPSQPRRVAPNC